MIEQVFLYTGIILFGLIKSGIAGVLVAIITSIVITGGDPEVIPAAFLAILFLLPAMFLYHLGEAIKLKQRICNVLYFTGFLSLELFFCTVIILAYVNKSGDGMESAGWGIFLLYIFTFTGISVYLAEAVFRTGRSIKESGHREIFERFDSRDISEKTPKQLQPALIGIIRSCIIAVAVVFAAATGNGFINLRLEPVFITKGEIYLMGLLPAIIIYHIAYHLKLKWWKCDAIYFVAFVVAEIFFLPSALNLDVPLYVTDPDYSLSHLPLYAMAVIALGGAAVYMTEVYFRNRVALKNLQTNVVNGASKIYSYYPVKRSLLVVGKFVVGFGIFAVIVGLVFGFVKYREQQKQDQMRSFVYHIIDSARNQTEFYKNNSKELAIEKLNESIGKMSGNFDISIGNYTTGFSSFNCQIVYENGNTFLADVSYEKDKFLLQRFVSKDSILKAKDEFLNAIKAVIADANKPENKKKEK